MKNREQIFGGFFKSVLRLKLMGNDSNKHFIGFCGSNCRNSLGTPRNLHEENRKSRMKKCLKKSDLEMKHVGSD